MEFSESAGVNARERGNNGFECTVWYSIQRTGTSVMQHATLVTVM